MLFMFQSLPLLITTDLVEQAKVRILLRHAGIQHRVKISRYSNDGAHTSLQGSAVDYSHEYTIYVRKKDFAHARQLCASCAQNG